MKHERIILISIYFVLFSFLSVFIFQRYNASVTGHFYFVGNDKARNITFNNKSCNVKVVTSKEYNEPLTLKNETLFVNLKLISKLNIPLNMVGYYNTSRNPTLYEFKKNRSNLVIIGDSYSEGGGLLSWQTYPAYLSELVNMNVVNLGIGGYNSKKEIQRFYQVGLKYNPKLVVLQYCSNDLEDTDEIWSLLWGSYNLLNKNGYDCENDWFHGNPTYMALYSSYYELIEKEKSKFLQNNVQVPLEKLNLLSGKHGFKVVMMVFGLSPDQKHFVKSIAENYNWTLIDLDRELNFKYKIPYIISQNNIHFSDWFNSKVAELLFKTINKSI